MASLIMVSSVKAIPPFPNLPPGTVNLTSDFLEDENNFDIISVLSNAPKGYDVHDGAYTGWCIDRRGFGTPTDSLVYLFSSLDLPPISEFPQVHQQDWNRINYIINKIPQKPHSGMSKKPYGPLELWAIHSPHPDLSLLKLSMMRMPMEATSFPQKAK